MKIARLNVTKYERSIVVLLARGYRPKQIAAALGMTPQQVCSARRRILDRNGITNDVQIGMLIEHCQLLSVHERNLIEDRREERLDAQRTHGGRTLEQHLSGQGAR